MSHFFVFFYVLAQISAPVARHSWRLWQIKAGAWSFYLPKSRPRASYWHLQITKTSMGGCFLVMSGYFSVFFCGCLGSLVLANASCCLELRFARASAQEEPLAPRSDQNKIFGIFLSVLGHFLARAWALGVGRGGLGIGTGDWTGDWGVGLRCGAGGKPSTWLPPGKLVEHSLLAATFFSEQALRYYNY